MTEVEAMETDVAQKSVLPLFGQLGQVNAGTDYASFTVFFRAIIKLN